MMPTRANRSWAQDLFGSPWRLAFTLAVLALAAWALAHLLPWGLLNASFAPSADACRARQDGACWGVVAEKWRPILFGRYPYAEQWRAAVLGIIEFLLELFERGFAKQRANLRSQV